MNREFPSNSEPGPLFNLHLVACLEDQNEYIHYHYIPFTLVPYQPKKSLTRVIDAQHLFLSKKKLD